VVVTMRSFFRAVGYALLISLMLAVSGMYGLIGVLVGCA
jgi:hypothetical protein